MNVIDDDTLQAYVDGELNTADAARIDAALLTDQLLARRVQQARALRVRLQATFDPVLEEPLPERLSALLQPIRLQAAPPAVHFAAPAGRRRKGAKQRRVVRRWLAPAAALAASLAIVAMGLWWQIGIGPGGVQDSRPFAEGALSTALDRSLASEPDPRAAVRIGLTFRAADGRICRSFTERGTPAMAGLACHADVGWSLAALSAVEPSGRGELEQAASAVPAEVQSAIEARIRGDAFDARQERAARDAGWRQP